MSENTSLVPAGAPTSDEHGKALAAGDSQGFFARITDVMRGATVALDQGAAFVYNKVTAVEGDVTKWTSDNEQLKPILDEGLAFVKSFLGRSASAAGVPVPTLELVADDLLSSLKSLAVSDSDMTTPVGTDKSKPAPQAKGGNSNNSSSDKS